MSAYTLSSGERLKHRWSTLMSLRSNHMCRLMTGMPSSSSIWRKKGIFCHAAGSMRFMMSTGMAEMYMSASIVDPSRISRHLTDPSSLVTIFLTGLLVLTSPPRASMYCFMGSHRRSGWFPSRKAIWRPLSSFRKRFIAVSTTVMLSLSGSMKSRALAMLMKTSVLMRSGMPYLRMNSRHESSSWSSINSCPLMSMGKSAGMH
mmetsp:Transcript_22416/g.55249  ORF Transcript_22416/g.55249 Transcript_22416/m.55249 type:complete len:203 (-) Transcript_22416:679-1287(-)